jgi:hypothetical protein
MTLSRDNKRLVHEVQLLQRCEAQHGLRAKPIIDRLVAESDRPLPDVLPPSPQWTTFTWPKSGVVDLTNYWREADKEQRYRGFYGPRL